MLVKVVSSLLLTSTELDGPAEIPWP